MESQNLQNAIIEINTNNQETQSSKGYITIPLEEENFKEFICSLLGEPQTIEGQFLGCFDIDIKAIENLYYLIQQRIEQQNKAKLISFTCKIEYNDHSAVKLGSLEELKTYNEIRPVYPVVTFLVWTYLIQFPRKNIAEKQEIEVNFGTHDILKNRLRRNPEDSKSGVIEYTIRHTERTWGCDIESLLRNTIQSTFIPENPIKFFARKYGSLISIMMSILILIMAITTCYLSTVKYTTLALSEVQATINNIDTSLDQKVNFITEYIAKGGWSKFNIEVILFLIIMLFISILAGVWVDKALDYIHPSFITLTDTARKNKEKELKALTKSWRMVLTSTIGSIFVGLVSNFIFFYIQKTL